MNKWLILKSIKRGKSINTVLLVLFILLSPLSIFNTQAQNNLITISASNESLDNVIRKIEKQSDYLFFYSSEGINKNELISIDKTNSTIEEILNEIASKTKLNYAIKDRHIILSKEKINDTTVQESVNQIDRSRKKVTGYVKDKNGDPVIGANISVKGSTTGTFSGLDGEYTILVPSSESLLTFTFLGCIPEEVKVGNRSEINVILEDNVQELDAVVVIGYGTMKKRDLTGAISQITPEKLAKESPTSVQDILRSGVAGLNVGMTNSAKGGGNVQVRGQRSLSASNDPLIVVDNMIFYGEMSEINPMDIEQIDILKDASSAAIYGARSANGVIIITTKKGKSGKPVIRFDASLGVSTRGSNREVYGPEGYLQFRSDWHNSNTGFETPGKYMRPTPENLSKNNLTIDEWRAYSSTSGTDDEIWLSRLELFDQEKENYFAGRTYDWYDHSFRTGIRQDYNMSLAGKAENINYYMSIGYLDAKGLIKGDDYKSIRANLKLDAAATKFMDVGINVNFQNRTDGNLAVDWKRQISENSPYALPYDQEGNLVMKPMGTNSLNEGWNYDFERQYKDLDRGYTTLNTNLFAKVKLPFNIRYSFNFAPRFQWYWDRYHESSQHPQWKESHNGLVNREQTKRYSWLVNNLINWDKTFAEKHAISITLSQEAEEHRRWKDRIEARDFSPTDALGNHYVQPADKLKSSFMSEDTHSTGDALMARAFYSFDSRYMTTVSVRRDGYSAFGTSNPRATFTSVALAWNFAEEAFFKWEPMSQGKLRLSWGSNGNRGVDIYSALSNLKTGTGSYAYIDANNELKEIYMLYVDRMANPNLRWEKTSSWNIGLDFGFLRHRINGSIELYNMPTTDLIMSQSLPDFTGFTKITTNLGKVVNKGFEFTINSANIQNRDFEWNTSFNFSLNKNQIKHLYYTYEDIIDDNGHIIGHKEIDDKANKWFIGKDINEIWDYRLEGIWQLGEEEEAAKYGQVPGDPKVKDSHDVESRKYTDEDKEFLGSKSPKFRWALRNDFTFLRNFNFSFNIYSQWGHKAAVTDYLNSGYTYARQNTYVREYWTPENPTNKFARLGSTTKAAGAPKIVDRSFIRLESISLAYTVPQSLVSKANISSLKLYGSVRNVAVWTKEWYNWDPEIDTDVSGPLPRTFTIGATLTF